MSFPGVTGSSVSLLLSARSARPGTMVLAVAVLSLVFGSAVSEVTVAEFTKIVPPGVVGSICTTSVKVYGPPTASGVIEQLTVPFMPIAGVVQAQPPGLASVTKVVPAGSGSLQLALAASFGPALFTVIVYVMSVSAAAKGGALL